MNGLYNLRCKTLEEYETKFVVYKGVNITPNYNGIYKISSKIYFDVVLMWIGNNIDNMKIIIQIIIILK